MRAKNSRRYKDVVCIIRSSGNTAIHWIFNKFEMVNMIDEIKEILKVCVELISTANELSKLENGCGVDYSDVITDLKWSKMTLENRLRTLKSGG